MAVSTYNPKDIHISLGSHNVTGYSDDAIVSIEPEGDGITALSGCDGEVARACDPNELYSITLTLLQTSPTNNHLAEQFRLDRSGGGDGSFTMVITGGLDGKVLFSGTAWVTKLATITRGKDLNNVEWTLMAQADEVNF